MAEITADAVRALRERTNLPLMKVKQALQQADGDPERAVEILKSQVKGLLDNRAANVTREGRIFVLTTPDGSEAAMVEVQCESSPVAGCEGFLKLGEALVTQLLQGPPVADPAALLAQPVPGGKGTLQDLLDEQLNQIREKMVVSRVIRVKGPVGYYIHHDGKTGVLFQADGQNLLAPILRDVAMHVAALKPTVARVEEVDPALVQRERDRLTAEAKATGKPDNIIEKMVDGKMRVYFRDEAGVLTEQMFAKDDSKSVSQVLAESGLKAKAFTLWVLGN